MIVNGYCTLLELKDWAPIGIQITEHDTKAENVVTSVSRWIDNYCDRHFWQTSAGVARVFDACGQYTLEVGDVTAVTEVATDDDRDGVYETVWAGTDWQLTPAGAPTAPEAKPYRKVKSLGRAFPLRTVETDREGLVRVTGTWGWPAVPVDVYQACLLQSGYIVRRKDSPEGVFGINDFGVVRMSGRLDPDVAALLGPYQVHPVRVA